MIDISEHKLLEKYLTSELKQEIWIESEEILDEIEFLTSYSKRVSIGCKKWTMIPEPKIFSGLYGCRQIYWNLRNILAGNDYWLSRQSCKNMRNYSLKYTMSALIVNSLILRDIFFHEDKDEINKELIPDFVQWFKVISKIHPEIDEIYKLYDIEFTDCAKFCNKEEKFKKEIDLILNK